MASVFLSYDREDAAKAGRVAQSLEEAGHSVWWDRHIKGGAQYSKEIDRALKQSEAVVVLWSEQSVESAWVRDEAAAGRDSGRLVPVKLDQAEPPLGFRQYQIIDLSHWRGRGKPRQLRQLLEAVASLQDMQPSSGTARRARNTPSLDRLRPRLRPRFRLIAALVVGLLIILLGLLVARPWEAKGTVPTIAIRPADTTPGARKLARDLLVQLGSGSGEPMQLVDEDSRDRPDLILEVATSNDSSATLMLVRASDRQLLSSEDITVPAGNNGGLKTSVAVAATSTLGCAAEALASRQKLRPDVLKQYLGACTPFNGLYGTEDVSILIPQLEQVVRSAPQFLPARKRLLLAGAYMRSIATEAARPSPEWLGAQIDAARRIEPGMPELRLAELEILPANDFAGRLGLIDGLRQAYPDDRFVLGARAEQLMLVGRNNEAVVDAERSARLDPLIPYSRSEYIRALAFSGRLSRAFEELDGVGSQPVSRVPTNLTETQFRLNMRYGDPRVALELLRRYGTSKAHEAFLLARIEPSPENVVRAIATSRAVASEQGFYAQLLEVLTAFGRDDEALQLLIRLPPQRVDQFTLQTLFRPTLKSVRHNPRFLRAAQRFGLLGYWKSSGNWPDFCLEPDLPYDCKAEAAKLSA